MELNASTLVSILADGHCVVSHIREGLTADVHFVRPIDVAGIPGADSARVVELLEMLESSGDVHRVEMADPYDPTEFEVHWSRVIRFCRANERPYGAFSNLYRRPMFLDGREYLTSEHAYQARKARTEAVREWIIAAPTPALAAIVGHGLYTWDVVERWSEIKFDHMRRVLRAKFTQHNDLRRLLLTTGNARLVETGRVKNVVNRTWAEVNGKGRNMLGLLLMELRQELRSEPEE